MRPEPETSLVTLDGWLMRSISPSPEMRRSAALAGAIEALPEPEMSASALSEARPPASTSPLPEMSSFSARALPLAVTLPLPLTSTFSSSWS